VLAKKYISFAWRQGGVHWNPAPVSYPSKGSDAARQRALQLPGHISTGAAVNHPVTVSEAGLVARELGEEPKRKPPRRWPRRLHKAAIRDQLLAVILGQVVHDLRNVFVLDRRAQVTARKGDKASSWTIKHELQTLRGATHLARDLGYHVNLDINWPTRDLKTKLGRLRFLAKEEELRLLAELDPNRGGRGLAPVEERQANQLRKMQDNYDFVIALLDTGMRYDEMAKLPWSAVDIAAGIIRIYRNKVNLADTFHMTDRLAEVMNGRSSDRRAGARYIFESANGGPRGYTAQGIKKAIDRAGLNDPHVVKDKGGKVTIHTLRHTFASRLVQAEVSLAKVSKLLGHSSITTTEIYAHLAPNEVSEEATKVLNGLQANPCAPRMLERTQYLSRETTH
jgi:integrase